MQVETAELLQGLWTAWLSFSRVCPGASESGGTAPVSTILPALAVGRGVSIQGHKVKALQLLLAARHISRQALLLLSPLKQQLPLLVVHVTEGYIQALGG